MKLTIGLPCAGSYEEVWFTTQALRLYQDLTDTEILIVDNGKEPHLERFVSSWAHRQVRHVRMEEQLGPAAAKNRVFAEARGEWVICMDSHVLLVPGAVARFRAWADAHPDCRDLLHGPLLYDDLISMADAMADEWRGGMWGTWRGGSPGPELEPYEIPMHGCGLLACRRDSWLGFHPGMRGFGGEEGVIHAKYRKAGRRVLCLPWLRWNHLFRVQAAPYPVTVEDRIRNYELGMGELGLDLAPMKAHFGR